MHQIDILLSSKENTSNIQLESLKATLKQRERDLSSLRVTIQEKTFQVCCLTKMGVVICYRLRNYVKNYFVLNISLK